MYCKKCGYEMKNSNARFCQNCGEEFTINQQDQFDYVSLVKLAQSGDEFAFTDLYNHYYPSMLKIAIKHTQVSGRNNESDAEDVLQDSMLKAYSSINTLEDPTKFPGWLTTIVKNRAMDVMTSASKKRNVSLSSLATEDKDGKELEYDPQDERETYQPDVALDNQTREEILNDVLSHLSEEQRTVTVLYFYDEMTMKEISEKLDIPQSTVIGRLQTAKKNIESEISDIQKKQGIKLYNISAIPFFMWLLGKARTEVEKQATTEVVKTMATVATNSAVGTAIEGGATSVVGTTTTTASTVASTSATATTATTAATATTSATAVGMTTATASTSTTVGATTAASSAAATGVTAATASTAAGISTAATVGTTATVATGASLATKIAVGAAIVVATTGGGYVGYKAITSSSSSTTSKKDKYTIEYKTTSKDWYLNVDEGVVETTDDFKETNSKTEDELLWIYHTESTTIIPSGSAYTSIKENVEDWSKQYDEEFSKEAEERYSEYGDGWEASIQTYTDSEYSDTDYQDTYLCWNTQTYTTQRADNKVISVVKAEDWFGNGSYSGPSTYGYVFDVEDGEIITLSDLVNDYSEFKTYIDNTVKDKLVEEYGNNLEYDNIPELLSNEENINWYLTEDGLVIIFNHGQLGSLADTSPCNEASYPYSEINEYIKDKYKIGLTKKSQTNKEEGTTNSVSTTESTKEYKGVKYTVPKGWTSIAVDSKSQLPSSTTVRWNMFEEGILLFKGNIDFSNPFIVISTVEAEGLGGDCGDACPVTLDSREFGDNWYSVTCAKSGQYHMYSALNIDNEETYELDWDAKSYDGLPNNENIVYSVMYVGHGEGSLEDDDVQKILSSLKLNVIGNLIYDIDIRNAKRLKCEPSLSGKDSSIDMHGQGSYGILEIKEADGYVWYRAGFNTWIRGDYGRFVQEEDY